MPTSPKVAAGFAGFLLAVAIAATADTTAPLALAHSVTAHSAGGTGKEWPPQRQKPQDPPLDQPLPFVYVDPAPQKGADTPSCGIMQTPCLSIAHAVATRVADHGTVWLAAGTYAGPMNRDVTVPRPMRLESLEGRDRTVVDCEKKSRCITATANATLRGITFRNGRVPLLGNFSSSSGGGGGERRRRRFSSAKRRLAHKLSALRATSRKTRKRRSEATRPFFVLNRGFGAAGYSRTPTRPVLEQCAHAEAATAEIVKLVQGSPWFLRHALGLLVRGILRSPDGHDRLLSMTQDLRKSVAGDSGPSSAKAQGPAPARRSSSSPSPAHFATAQPRNTASVKGWARSGRPLSTGHSAVFVARSPPSARSLPPPRLRAFIPWRTLIRRRAGAAPRATAPRQAATDANLPSRTGGGVLALGVSLTVVECSFEDCQAAHGGGLGALDSDVEVKDSRFEGNTANQGGGVFVSGGWISLEGDDVVGNAVVNAGLAPHPVTEATNISNVAAGAGACLIRTSGSVTNCTFWGNFGRSGGGGDGGWATSAGGGVFSLATNLAISNSKLSANQLKSSGNACRSFGGGLCMLGGEVVVLNSELSFNVLDAGCPSRPCDASSHSGGVYVDGNMSLKFSRLSHNTLVSSGSDSASSEGGGLVFQRGQLFVSSSKISNNTLFSSGFSLGGGFFVYGVRGDSVLTMKWSQLSQNTLEARVGCGGGGAFVQDGSLSFQSSELSHNTLSSGARSIGGGLYMDHGDLSMESSVLNFNHLECPHHHCGSFGGGIFVLGGNVDLSNSELSSNLLRSKFYSHGGGLYMEGWPSGNISTTYSRLSNNTLSAEEAKGGGLIIRGGDLSVRSSHLSNNSLFGKNVEGGGSYIIQSGHVTLASSRFSGNTARGSHQARAGGLFSTGEGLSGFSSCLIADNTAACSFPGCSAGGGGIVLESARHVAMAHTRIQSNVAEADLVRGGGLLAVALSRVEASNVTIVGNEVLHRSHAFLLEAKPLSSCRKTVASSSQCKTGHHFAIPAGSALCGGFELRGYLGFSNCSVSIGLPRDLYVSGLRLRVRMVFFDIEEGGPSRCADTLAIEEAGMSGLHCGPRAQSAICSKGTNCKTPEQLSNGWTVQGLNVVFRFVSDQFNHRLGFGLRYSVVRDARNHSSAGGGISVSSASNLNGSGVVIHSNSATSAIQAVGGGISVEGERSSVQLIGSEISRNRVVSSGWKKAKMDAYLNRDNFGGLAGLWLPSSTFSTQDVIGQSMGAGLSVSSWGRLSLHGTVVKSNRAEGSGETVGGGLSVVDAAAKVSNVTLALNSATCDFSRCTATGGAVAVGGFGTLETNATDILSNVVQSAGTTSAGGALSAVDDGEAILRAGACEGNQAAMGGCLYLGGRSSLEWTGARGAGNRARVAGGFAALFQASSLGLTDAFMRNNSAAGVGGVLYAVDESVTVDFQHSIVSGEDSEVHALMYARRIQVGVTRGTVWKCGSGGTVVELGEFSRSFRMECVTCPPGTFSLAESSSLSPGQCQGCPSGSSCREGGDRVAAKRGHWGMLVNKSTSSVVQMARCPDAYCCREEACLPFNFCAGNRTGRLCGRCTAGHSETLGGTGCTPDGRCTHLWWLLPAALLATLGFVRGVVYRKGRRASELHAAAQGALALPQCTEHGETKAVIFFFQVLPLIISPETREAQSAFLQVVISVFNLELRDGLSEASSQLGGSEGWCPFPGFSALTKLASGYVLPGLLVVWVALSFLSHSLLHRFRKANNRQSSRYSGFGAQVAAMFLVLGLGYSTFLRTSFQLLSCISLPSGEIVLFRNAETACYQPWQTVLISLAVPVFLLYPLVLVGVVRRLRPKLQSSFGSTTHVNAGTHGHTVARPLLSISQRLVLDVVVAPYDEKRGLSNHWEAVLMAQRLVLVIVSVFVLDPVWHAWSLTALVSVFTVVHLLCRPFKRTAPNVLMACFNSILVFLGAWEVGVGVHREHGLQLHHDRLVVPFGAIIGILTLFPFCAGILLTLFRFKSVLKGLQKRVFRRSKRHQAADKRQRGLEVGGLVEKASFCVVCTHDDVDFEVEYPATFQTCEEHALC